MECERKMWSWKLFKVKKYIIEKLLIENRIKICNYEKENEKNSDVIQSILYAEWMAWNEKKLDAARLCNAINDEFWNENLIKRMLTKYKMNQ